MEQPDIPLRSPSTAGGDPRLEEQFRSLRGTVTMLLIAVCCVGAGMGLYLYRQVVQLNGQVIEAQRVVQDYQTNALPRIKWFVGSLQNYAKTNPDFDPVLAKYGLLPSNALPASTSLPAHPAAQKK